MARNKKSLFEWLTGSAEDDFSFDELEQGGSYAQEKPKHLQINVQDRNTPAPVAQAAEEELAGELAVDVYQTPTHIFIKAMIAGVKPEDLDVSITRDMVTIRGRRERHTEGTNGDFFFQELYWGAFTRTIVLPQEVVIEEAEASEKHGLLTIKLPKLDKGRQAKLKVKSN
ncbi:MAG TPA: Hsp20/alpha crystallin family protein [Candidatus Paceibacterota bacterium]